ncbi:MAG: hypothetical protein ABSH12_02120 [Endomicrobiales bacterium]
MGKTKLGFTGLIVSMVLAGSFAMTGIANAGVNIEVNLGAPVVREEAPAEVVYAPALGVYFVPDAQYDIFYFHGMWWSHRGNHWYRSPYYRNGWAIVKNWEVPRPVFNVPRDYRVRYGRAQHIRYRDWKEHPNQPPRDRNDHDDRGQERDHGGDWAR